jgi:hypothetical protein
MSFSNERQMVHVGVLPYNEQQHYYEQGRAYNDHSLKLTLCPVAEREVEGVKFEEKDLNSIVLSYKGPDL